MMYRTAAVLALIPMTAFGAGTDDFAPPKPSETTQVCADGLVWDLATKSCLTPDESSNDDSARLNDVRELAYAGQYQAALDVLDTLEDQESTLALTYYGFAHRKAGRVDLGMQYYNAALARDPNNLLVRSYMGQSLVEQGKVVRAAIQLDEIRARGGQGTWAETALAEAIRSGATFNY